MQNTYFKTDFESSLSGLVLTDEPIGTLMPFNPYGVWLFGVDSSSLVDVSGKGNVLTVVDDKTTYPQDAVTFSDNSVGIPNLVGKYLETGISDSESITIIGVAKYSTTRISVIAGNLQLSTESTKSNWGVFTSAGKLYFSLRSFAPNASSIGSATTNQELTVNDYFLYAVSINKAAGSVVIYSKNGGTEMHTTAAFSGGYLPNGTTVALGNKNYSAALVVDPTSHAETTIYKKALTLDEIKTAASYAVARCASRGTDI